MQQLPTKFKVMVSIEELREIRNKIEDFLDKYEELRFDRDKEQETYRLADIHHLYYNWLYGKIHHMEKNRKVQGKYEMPLTHILTLWHILQKLPISRLLQRNTLKQFDKIRQSALDINYGNKVLENPQ